MTSVVPGGLKTVHKKPMIIGLERAKTLVQEMVLSVLMENVLAIYPSQLTN